MPKNAHVVKTWTRTTPGTLHGLVTWTFKLESSPNAVGTFMGTLYQGQYIVDCVDEFTSPYTVLRLLYRSMQRMVQRREVYTPGQ